MAENDERERQTRDYLRGFAVGYEEGIAESEGVTVNQPIECDISSDDVVLLDCGEYHESRTGPQWKTAAEVIDWALSLPSHQLKLVVPRRAQVQTYVGAIAAVAHERDCRLFVKRGSYLQWPNGASVRVVAADSQALV